MEVAMREAPQSSIRKKEYQAKMAGIKTRQEKEFMERKKENAKYAEATTEKLLDKYYQQEREILEKKASIQEGFYVPKEAEFFVVILIRSKLRCPPKVKKVLQLFRLKKTNTCMFVKNNKSTKRMLHIIKDYVAFGTIDMELLRKLMYTRGTGRNGNARVKLTNEFIEDMFDGKIKCIEELVYHIYNGTEMFRDVNNFLYPFHLSPPRGGFKGKKSRNFNDGGSVGNHQDLLGNLLKRMI
ncbi:60S ribosomal protein L7 [Encephalitozoon intestinalis ATCC 50506]|uniref:60S ribosomal protein L7 n=1 Tax=Encephalitozoon intestinalis (strain ATCC 50506) TaxID=876142 RepID=E0S693_ENCIT|nr:60S ribosomal protein L7 [Encephalitozoon intestinalis ATCC 50506]ADM11228.1 60S ribosomal protein L7 [Encephalitozoon intestinalis ATCC 50506]UTX44896.1 ribosomal protein L7 [Encephalitozoon intestinalis]